MKQLALLVTLLALDATYMQPKAELLNKNNGMQKITYLFPAPPILPAFGPIQIAKGKGYFSDRKSVV